MLLFDGALGLVMLALWLFCLIDVITTDSASIRNLPKLAWLLIVLVLVDIGSVLWLIAGRSWDGGGLGSSGAVGARRGRTPAYPEYDRPGRFIPTNPDDDEEFLRGLRDRAEQQRRDYRARREAELQSEDERLRRRSEEPPESPV